MERFAWFRKPPWNLGCDRNDSGPPAERLLCRGSLSLAMVAFDRRAARIRERTAVDCPLLRRSGNSVGLRQHRTGRRLLPVSESDSARTVPPSRQRRIRPIARFAGWGVARAAGSCATEARSPRRLARAHVRRTTGLSAEPHGFSAFRSKCDRVQLWRLVTRPSGTPTDESRGARPSSDVVWGLSAALSAPFA